MSASHVVSYSARPFIALFLALHSPQSVSSSAEPNSIYKVVIVFPLTLLRSGSDCRPFADLRN
jgi:hypothetical protein